MIDAGESPERLRRARAGRGNRLRGRRPPRLLRSLFADPSSSNASFHVFLIENAVPKFAQSLDVTETIVVETATLDELQAAVRDGRLGSGSQVAAAFILLDHLR